MNSGVEAPPKIGLALSGGGMRAAYFHVGVLARLAEVGRLSQVRVISTVSGGTLVGALYYVLLLRKQPQSDADYVRLLHKLACCFREAGRHNLRARTFCNPFKNLDMLIRPDYTRSDRIGDLLDRLFYRPSWGETDPRIAGAVRKQIELRQLESVHLPELIINSTCLNSGHNWRFTPKGMGEPAPDLATDRGKRLDRIDRNMRLAWAPFSEIGASQSDFPLGLAVAASAAFPGLFSPLPISNLFPGIRVRLFDGGLHDNQGIEALRGAKCSQCIESDAGGQMEDQARPKPILTALIGRVISTYGDRVREEQLVAVDWDANVLIHLREGLLRTVLHPYGASGVELQEPEVEAAPKPAADISPAAQLGIARIRTDLDAFSDREAYALMLDGYRLARRQLPGPLAPDVAADPELANGPAWPFDVAATMLQSPTKTELGILATASKRLLKPLAQPPFGHIRWAVFLGIVALTLLPLYYDALTDVLAETALWRGLLLLVPLAAVLPAAGWALTRGTEYLLRGRLATGRPGTISRWTVRIGACAIASGVAFGLGGWESFREWARVGENWSLWWATAAAAIGIVLPAALALLLGLLMWIVGRAHLARGKFG